MPGPCDGSPAGACRAVLAVGGSDREDEAGGLCVSRPTPSRVKSREWGKGSVCLSVSSLSLSEMIDDSSKC